MLKLAALGALGYAGYKYYQKNMSQTDQGSTSRPRTATAGGPMSDEVAVRSMSNSSSSLR